MRQPVAWQRPHRPPTTDGVERETPGHPAEHRLISRLLATSVPVRPPARLCRTRPVDRTLQAFWTVPSRSRRCRRPRGPTGPARCRRGTSGAAPRCCSRSSPNARRKPPLRSPATTASVQRLDQDLTDHRLCAAIVDLLTFGGNIIESGSSSYRLAQARGQRAMRDGSPLPRRPGLSARSDGGPWAARRPSVWTQPRADATRTPGLERPRPGPALGSRTMRGAGTALYRDAWRLGLVSGLHYRSCRCRCTLRP